MEIKYRLSGSWKPCDAEYEYDTNFGSLDIETYPVDKGAKGYLCLPYACGFRDAKNHHKLYYLASGESNINLIVRMLHDLLVRGNDKTKFYVHNLAGFDSRFLLEALGVMHDCNVVLLGRGMNEIFNIKISKMVGKRRISINISDSYYILSQKLEVLAVKMGGNNEVNTKGYFPHDFVSKNNLYYEGAIPDYSFYKRYICLEEYKSISNIYMGGIKWSLKEECLKYLKRDLDSLHYVMNTFNRSVFDKYMVNTTSLSSYSALSKKVYLTNYYRDQECSIPIISGYVESETRKGYKGGIVDVLEHIVTDGYKYDSNSHYPAAMLNTMPVGNPTLTDIKDLSKIFGFCYAKVTAPSVSELKVPLLPYTDPETDDLTCPRGTFEGMYFSEELKDVIKYGYRVEIISSIVFQRGEGLFKDFIEELFKCKAEAKMAGDSVHELIYKLLQNSFYGKSGQKEIEYSFKFIMNDVLEEYEKKHDTDLTHRFGDKVLVREHGVIPEPISSLIESTSSSSSTKYKLPIPPRKQGGVKSSVPIAAAITAYARMAMYRFKNIPGNPYLGGDTDSAILQFPLDDTYVGKRLGEMKLEYKIAKGLFADKKLYWVKTDTDEIIIKSRGIGLDFHGQDILQYDDFISLFTGKNLNISKKKFMIEKDGVYIRDVPMNVCIQSDVYPYVEEEINTILSKPDGSLKYQIANEINIKKKENR